MSCIRPWWKRSIATAGPVSGNPRTPKGNFLYAPVYLDIPHTDDLVVVQITLNQGRTVELKKALYKAIAEGLQKAIGLKPEDAFISLVGQKGKTGRSGMAWRSTLVEVPRIRSA